MNRGSTATDSWLRALETRSPTLSDSLTAVFDGDDDLRLPTHYPGVFEQVWAGKMMIGKSIPEYIFIRSAISALRLIAPAGLLCVAWILIAEPAQREWWNVDERLLLYLFVEAAFFVCVYLPRRYHLQKEANHPRLTREERRALFERCSECPMSSDYPSGWFFQPGFRRKNLVEWLLWALFSSPVDASQEEWEDEIVDYLIGAENTLGQAIPEGYDKDTRCMRPTLDPVVMHHRPLLWYLIVGTIDFMASLRLYTLGFRHYTGGGSYQSFPPRPFTIFSRPSDIEGLSFWYRPHRSQNKKPVLFLHGIGIGLHPYTAFLADIASQHPDVGIIVPEFLSISSRITSPPLSRTATIRAIRHILDTLSLPRVVIASHSYGTAITAQILRSPDLESRVSATLLVDPIPFLLHLPDVAFNFLYRSPKTANEWLLWYFASRDPDISRTLLRHFFWAENILWKEDLRGKAVAVALSGQDQVVNSRQVRRYLTGEDEIKEYWQAGNLEVLYYSKLDHAMIFHTKERRNRLMEVLGRFIKEFATAP